MGRWIWQQVLAFDRVGRRFPRLVQIWLVEFFIVLGLAFFLGKVLDARGALGCPGSGEGPDGTFYGLLAIALLGLFFFFRNLLRPRISEETWTPVVDAGLGLAGVGLVVANRRWSVRYPYLSSHPSYALLLLLTLPVPWMMVAMTADQGCSTLYWRLAGWVGLAVIATLALVRALAWYVFRIGPRALAQRMAAVPADAGPGLRRLGWEMAWKPTIGLVALIWAIGGLPIAWMFWQQARLEQALPMLDAVRFEGGLAAHPEFEGQLVRVQGRPSGELRQWAPRGAGRGGNNYAGGGILLDLGAGGEVLVLASAGWLPTLKQALREPPPVAVMGRVVTSVTEDQRTWQGYVPEEFDTPVPAAGRIWLVYETP